jgi:hypothetical protein
LPSTRGLLTKSGTRGTMFLGLGEEEYGDLHESANLAWALGPGGIEPRQFRRDIESNLLNRASRDRVHDIYNCI